MIQNQKGFALVITMALLPLVIAGFFLAWATAGFFQQDLAMKYACRAEGIKGQEQVAKFLKKLLDLNPKAIKLKADFDFALDQAIAARARNDLLSFAKWSKKALDLGRQRFKLRAQQQRLIQESNRLLVHFHSEGKLAVRTNASRNSNSFLGLKLINISGQPSRLAVIPQYPDIAPPYRPVFNFDSAQALAHEWKYKVSVEKPFSLFLPGEFEFTKSCAVTLKEEISKWTPKITKARYSWKSVW